MFVIAGFGLFITIASADGSYYNGTYTLSGGENVTEIPNIIPAESTKVIITGTIIATLKANVFQNLSKCEIMVFVGNSISYIERGAFYGLGNLDFLIIHQSIHPDALKPGVLSGLSSLTMLSLGSNNLTTLDSRVFEDLPRPLQLEVAGNPLECNNSLCWLKEEIRNKTITWMYGAPQCSSGASWDSWYTCPGKFLVFQIGRIYGQLPSGK